MAAGSSPTGPALTPKGERTRSRIVAVAADLMFENGVAGTTIEDVRIAAGVSNSQIYHYFSDKAELIRAVIDHQTDAVLEPQQPIFSRLDTWEGLQDWRDYAVNHQKELNCRGGCPIASLSGQLAEADDAARLQLALSFRRWSAGLRSGLLAMAERGALSADADPEQLAVVLLTSLQGGLLLTQLERDVAPLETALDAALEHVRIRMTTVPA